MTKCAVSAAILCESQKISVTVFTVVDGKSTRTASSDASSTTKKMASLCNVHYVGQTGDLMVLISSTKTRRDSGTRKKRRTCRTIVEKQLDNWLEEQQKVLKVYRRMIEHLIAHAVRDIFYMRPNTSAWCVQISRSASCASTLNFTRITSSWLDLDQTKTGSLPQGTGLANKMNNTKR